MSRRRTLKRAETPGSPVGRHPGDLYAGVDVDDPAGHRMVRFRFFLHEPADSWDFEYAGKSLSPRTYFGYVPHDEDPDQPREFLFGCRTCRDNGDSWETTVPADVVRTTITALWESCKRNGDTPDRVVIVSVASDVLY